MENSMPFGEILDEVDKLPVRDQETLRDILAKRIIEHRRDQLVNEIKEAREEHKAGQCKPATADEILNEIIS
jgi:hypothetical protein